MTIDITYDPEIQEIILVYQNAVFIKAIKDEDGHISYNKNIQQLNDDELHMIKTIVNAIFSFDNEN